MLRGFSLLLALGLLALGLAAPAGAEARAYRAFVGCGADFPEPDHMCSIGAAPAAYLKPFRRAVRYKLCVRNPVGRTRCRGGQAPRRKYHWLYVARGMVGEYRATWFVGGKRVARWRYRMFPEIGA